MNVKHKRLEFTEQTVHSELNLNLGKPQAFTLPNTMTKINRLLSMMQCNKPGPDICALTV